MAEPLYEVRGAGSAWRGRIVRCLTMRRGNVLVKDVATGERGVIPWRTLRRKGAG